MLKDYFEPIWDEHDGLDQYQLRDKAFAAIPADEYPDLLYEALLNDAYAFILGKRGERKPSAGHVRTGTDGTARRSAGTANSARSSKQRSLREQWPMLRCSYGLAAGRNAPRKNLESMSAEDCRSAASVNRALAEGNNRRADWLEEIAQEMTTHRSKTVAKLPASVLTELQESAP